MGPQHLEHLGQNPDLLLQQTALEGAALCPEEPLGYLWFTQHFPSIFYDYTEEVIPKPYLK